MNGKVYNGRRIGIDPRADGGSLANYLRGVSVRRLVGGLWQSNQWR